jgi:phosphoribosylamine---glycine ligase
MKILIHSDEGDVNGLVLPFQEEGHKVFVYQKHKNDALNGLCEKVGSMSEGIKERPDLIIFDGVGDGKFADSLISAGLPVFGAHKLADDLEIDRKFGADFMKKHGIKIPETTEFTSLDKAIKFVEGKPAGYVIKMDDPEASKASSYVGKTPEDILEYLKHLKETGEVKDGESFILQEFVKGVEVSTECWFSNGKPIPPFNNDFETKRFFPGDLGENTGCETSVLFKHTGESLIVKKTMKKVFKALEEMGYTGILDINCIVSEKDHEPYGLEWTARMGYSSIYAACAMVGEGLGEMFLRLATGDIDKIPFKNLWGTSLRANSPPYPLQVPDNLKIERELYSKLSGQKIFYKKSKNLYFLDVMKGKKDGEMVIAGYDGCVVECTGEGSRLPKAWDISKKEFDGVKFPNKRGRYIDGIESATDRIKKLRSWGYDMPSPDNVEPVSDGMVRV